MSLLVIDFDGSLTDVDEECIPFVESYRDQLRDTLIKNRRDLTQGEFDDLWKLVGKEIDNNPTKYGWWNEGVIIAPAYADPILHSQAIANYIFDQFGLFTGAEERRDQLQDFYSKCYPKTGTAFKDGAKDFLDKASKETKAFIVTNARTVGVEEKLDDLGMKGVIPVEGNAKKFELDFSWDGAPRSVDKGFGRPVYLQRRNYKEILSKLMKKARVGPEQTTVLGDIYELDLALPEYLGMRIVHTPRANTAQFEVDAVKNAERGSVVYSLEEAAAVVFNR